MPWNGDGTFTQTVGPSPVFNGPDVWTQDANASILIESARHDYHDQDLADGINACLNKNGANSPTSNIDWGSFKITNIGPGTTATDAAQFGQTITAATLNAGTNVLTLARMEGDVTVDLSALAVGGSTADFARYSNADNPFTGNATFDGTLSCAFSFGMIPIAGTAVTWTEQATTATRLDWTNTAGAQLTFSGNAGAASLAINGAAAWTTASLPSSTFTGVLKTDSNPTLTGSWTFAGGIGSVILPPSMTQAGIGSGYNALYSVPSSTTWQLGLSGGGGMSIFSDTAYLSKLRIGNAGANIAWHGGNLRSNTTSAPTGGNANDLAVVPTGADRGLWQNLAGTWTKLIAFP